MHKFNDLTGRRFGKWTVLQNLGPNIKRASRHRMWLCQCDCGNQSKIPSSNLTTGLSTSCGCVRSLSKKEDAIKSSAKQVYRQNYSDGDLSFDDFIKISQLNCQYCGNPPSNSTNRHLTRKSASMFAKENGTFIYNGLDRIDSNQGHNKNNVVPCCYVCNIMKFDLSLDDFYNHLIKIVHHLKLSEGK